MILTPDSLRQVGIRSKETGEAATRKPFWEEYDELPPDLAREVAEVENGLRYAERKPDGRTEETIAYLHEDNYNSRKQYRLEMQEELKQERTGRILHMNEFYFLLKRCDLNPSYTDKGWRPGMLGLSVCPDGEHKQYVCFIQVPFMQEYEEVYFDQFDVPLGPKRRGWRTVLLRLITSGLLSEQKAHEVFGEPPSNASSRRYREELHRHRNRKQDA